MEQKISYSRLIGAFIMVILLSTTAHAVTWAEWTKERVSEAEAMASLKKASECIELKARASWKMNELKTSWEAFGARPQTKEAALTAKTALQDFMGRCEWDEDVLPLYRALKDFISQLP